MKKEAIDYISTEIEYERPYFVFPDLNSPEGNPMEYFKMAQATLQENGFKKESKELGDLRFSKYSDHFDIINRYLNFSHSKVVTEDEEYIHIKIKKSSKLTTQPRVFYEKSEEDIKDLIEQNHDFSLTNCYNRNHLHYLNDAKAIKLLLEENKNQQWFDLFDLDNFNSTLLHGKNLESFTVILTAMYEESPAMTKVFLYGENCFSKNAFGDFLKDCDSIFSPKQNMPQQKTIDDITKVISIIGKIDPQKRDELLNAFVTVEEKNPSFKDANLKQTIFRTTLESELSNEKTNNKKLKI